MFNVFAQTIASADDDDDVVQPTPKKKAKTVALGQPEETTGIVQEDVTNEKGSTC